MSFNNSGESRPRYNGNLEANISSLPVTPNRSKNVGLNSPMIDRVHKAKSGCSACGKKVA